MKLETNFIQKQKQQQSMKLVMTQQLSQSIAMLQYTTVELVAFLEDKALENPLIEVIPGSDVATDFSYVKRNNYSNTENNFLDQVADTQATLADQLKEQLTLMTLPPSEKMIVLYLIESLDSSGYLTVDLKTAGMALLTSEEKVFYCLEILQSMEPAGIGARDAKECILLQMKRKTNIPAFAYKIINDHFQDFAAKKWKRIAVQLHIDLQKIQAVSDFIQTLVPKPGADFETERIQYIVPDLILYQNNTELQVSIATQFLPQIRFQQEYYQNLHSTQEKDVHHFLNEKAKEYNWLKQGMEQRETTLKRVGTAIIAHQKSYFTKITPSLKPLTLKEVASELAIHESTVSRAVNGKYIETSQGIFELKAFFTSSLTRKDEHTLEEVSSAGVKMLIAEFVSQENKAKPLSDQNIVDLLAQKKIAVSRRAIAKYRSELKIPASSKRKRYDEIS
ncbi:RNA polymerase factor sigma-54 [Listeria sp. PSOL-1]|uniref:RNA polymerase factor sigma-54 n=1 Tax=Listeria sp. PSOL-1 TaxID=1844999 RepID=UPI0013D3C62B|nr:RNA polymerase factor sigma-54 [Listeria sp. PSOL-1]